MNKTNPIALSNMNYFDEIEAVFRMLKLPKNIEELVKEYLFRHWSEMPTLSNEAYKGEIPDFQICRRKPLTRLAIIIYLLTDKKRILESKDIDEKIIAETFQDVSLRAKLYFESHGKIGISKQDACWHRHIMNLKIFKIGELQFQDFDMIYLDKEGIGEDYMKFSEEQKERLPKGTPVLNVHIQRGALLNIDSVKKSFDEARLFFQKFFPNRKYQAFICCSWLLYPNMDEILPEHSNIRDFKKLFHVIGQVQDSEDAIRDIFGKRYRAKKDFPQNTSLQISALQSMHHLGMGFGIIDF